MRMSDAREWKKWRCKNNRCVKKYRILNTGGVKKVAWQPSDRHWLGCCQAGAARQSRTCPNRTPRGKQPQNEHAWVHAASLSLAAAALDVPCGDHCSKLCASSSERWLDTGEPCLGSADPQCSGAQLRLSTQTAIIAGSTTSSITELLDTEGRALLIKVYKHSSSICLLSVAGLFECCQSSDKLSNFLKSVQKCLADD